MVSFSFDRFMRGLASGSDSGLGSFAKPYVQGKTQDALNKGIGQIQEGDWNGGISTIGEWSPDTALGLAQYKQESDDRMALQQAKMQQEAELRNTLTPYQQEMLALKRQQIAQGGSGSNGFGNTQAGLALRIASEPDKYSPEQVSWANNYLMSGDLDYTYNQAYQKKRGSAQADIETRGDISYQKKSGTLQAEREGKNLENQQISRQQQANLSNAINLVDTLPDNLFMPYSEISSGTGTLTGGMIGMSPEENEKYGYLERTIGTIENDLIAKARSKGQVGINTIEEIRQAAKGLQLGRGKERLKGALRAMYEIEQRLDAMPTVMTPIPYNQSQQRPQQNIDYSNASDDNILQGLR